MQMEVRRETSEKKGMLGGKSTLFSLNIKITPTEGEKKLFQKYNFTDLEVSCHDIGESIVERPLGRTTFTTLCEGRKWVSKDILSEDFVQIPVRIGGELRKLIGIMLSREAWHGRNETIDILGEPSIEGAEELAQPAE